MNGEDALFNVEFEAYLAQAQIELVKWQEQNSAHTDVLDDGDEQIDRQNPP